MDWKCQYAYSGSVHKKSLETMANLVAISMPKFQLWSWNTTSQQKEATSSYEKNLILDLGQEMSKKNTELLTTDSIEAIKDH